MGSAPLRKEDVIESFIKSSGPGGQNVNKLSTCVELVHIPTGIRIKCQKYRQQHQNRQLAWELLEKAIIQKYQEAIKLEKSLREKFKRQQRKRSKLAKEKMLANKKIHAFKKAKRRKQHEEE